MNNNKIFDNRKLLSKWFNNSDFYSQNYLKNKSQIFSDGEKKAIQLFHSVAVRVPAYKDFLKKQRISVSLIKSIADFDQIPLTTKENYIQSYPIAQRCWDGNMTTMHMISTSSGTTGQPHFWPRDLQSEIDGAYVHEYIFKNIFEVASKKTLFIDGFAMGNWIAGTFTSACANLVAWKGYPLTIMTPGYSADEIIKILLSLSFEFDQIIIAGHTPFLKELVEQAISAGVDFGKIKTRLLGTGQGITENWRKYILKLLQSEDYQHTFLNLYGSADAALMGFETPETIDIRKKLTQDQIKIFFHDERLPSIYAYDPRLTFFGQENRELIITKNSGCPLIRYNIHDQGGICPDALFIKENISLPMAYLFGREKFMVKIYGANIYSEHVQQALNHSSLQQHLTGRFLMESIIDDNQNPQLVCHVELVEGKNAEGLEKIVQEVFIAEVRKINSEYNFVLSGMGKKVWPGIILHPNGDTKYFPKGIVKKNA